jgi:hypothetical protein
VLDGTVRVSDAHDGAGGRPCPTLLPEGGWQVRAMITRGYPWRTRMRRDEAAKPPGEPRNAPRSSAERIRSS